MLIQCVPNWNFLYKKKTQDFGGDDKDYMLGEIYH